MRVFLTGGTGLIGSHVAERLRERGDAVTALVRPTSDTGHLEKLGCDLAVGDLMDPPSETAARMRGADAVVHAAAKVFQAGSRAEYLEVNVEGTERVLEAAATAAPRCVHVSSVAVYSGLAMDRPLTEDRWTDADPGRQNRYAASKHLSEHAAWRLHESGRLRLTTVRPAVVYGERDRAATPVVVRYASLPVVPIPGGGRTTAPVVYAGNVARGIVAALDRPSAVGRAYNLALDEPLTTRRLLRLFQHQLGRRRPVLGLPCAPLGALAAALETATRLLPGVEAMEARRGVRSLCHSNPYVSARARLELGWGAQVSHDEAVRRTVAWWRSRESRPPPD